MKFSKSLLFMGAVLSGALYSGCNQDDTPEPNNTEGLVQIASGYTDQGNLKISIYSDDSLYSRYTDLFIEVRDSATEQLIEDAHISITPMMQMQAMNHSAPFEDPVSTDAVDGLFPCAVVFQMPGDMGWSLTVHVHEHVNGREGEVVFPLVVKEAYPVRTRVVTQLNDPAATLVISYLQPTDAQVGINDLELTLHSKASMMSWPAVENYSIEIEPEMPSMGHGSPNNVNPTHVVNGHYKGQVNFTMTGLWRINLRVMDGTTVVDSTTYFEVTLQ